MRYMVVVHGNLKECVMSYFWFFLGLLSVIMVLRHISNTYGSD
ncbi:hypothetical protein [Desulfohalovibrio reitneri]|nr:hypothetical protein [Desulfohalovibrio reitneri]